MADQGERIGLYGSGGIGKTELAASLSAVGIEPLFIDLDQGSMGLDVARAVSGDDEHLTRTFSEVRGVLQNHELIRQFGAVVIDTFTTLEDRIREHVIATIPHEKGKTITSIEDYGFGKGLSHIFDQSLLVLADLEAISRLGIHVVVICHQVSEKVPSVESEDFLEYQPRLQSPGKTAKLRELVRGKLIPATSVPSIRSRPPRPGQNTGRCPTGESSLRRFHTPKVLTNSGQRCLEGKKMIASNEDVNDKGDDFDVENVIAVAQSVKDRIEGALIGQAKSVEDLRRLSNFVYIGSEAAKEAHSASPASAQEENAMMLLMIQIGAAQIQIWAGNKSKDWKDLG